MTMYIKDTLKASISGNAATATTLQTARNINGTSFNGSASITTANWGTARTLTVGSTGKSVNGSANITWTLDEIGAAPKSHDHNRIVTRDNVTCESGITARPAVSGLSMTQAYNNGYPHNYGNIISLRGQGDGQLFIGWSGTDGAHAPMYVRNKRDNTTTADWSPWAKVYTEAFKPTPSEIGALPLTGGTLTGRLWADGKISVKARGGSWIDTVNFDNVAIANITEPGSEGAYYPFLAARTDGGHTISLGSNYTNFGFYGFKNGRTENGVDLQFSFDVNAHTTYTNTWMKIDNGMEVAHDLNASLFRPKYAPGSQNCYIGGGNGDAASWDSHNMVIRSHWGIGFRDYQDICRIVMDTRAGSISSQGNIYSGSQLLSETGLYTNGTVTSAGTITAYSDLVCNGRAWINNATLSGMFIGEHKFSVDGAWGDPWEGVGCAIKTHGHIATNYTVKAGYLNASQGEFNGWPGGSDSFIKVRTEHDGNGQGDGVTHLGYNNGDGYHHFFRGTGAMHVNMHQGLQISNDFIYLAGVPLTISGNAPGRGGVWIQI